MRGGCSRASQALRCEALALPMTILDDRVFEFFAQFAQQVFQCRLTDHLSGDGILNGMDACPDTPAGVRVDDTGCTLAEVIVLEGVTFVSNSDELIGDSHAVLNKLADTLKRYPELRVEVGGHTDWQGPASYNQKLSERRANAVRRYLTEQGVAADNLTAKGYGESMPVADNQSAEGRAKNRRVELSRID